jgi:hypothetical protein
MRKNSEGIEIEYRTFKRICEKERNDNIVILLEEIKRKLNYPPSTDMAIIEWSLQNMLNEL